MLDKSAQAVRGPVRISLPAKVAYDPDMLKRSVVSILEEIGCPKCFSGADCILENFRQFVIDQDLNVGRVAGPEPTPWKGVGVPSLQRSVNVVVSEKVKYDIDKVFVAIDKVIDIIGPHPCISGFDLHIQDMIDLVSVDAKLEAERIGVQF